MEYYIIGSTEPAPAWCRSLLMIYQKMNGSTGVEFQNRCFGTVRVYQLFPGDTLLHKSNGHIEIKRKSKQGGDANDQLEKRSH